MLNGLTPREAYRRLWPTHTFLRGGPLNTMGFSSTQSNLNKAALGKPVENTEHLPFPLRADAESFSPSGFKVGGLLWTSFHHPGSPNS